MKDGKEQGEHFSLIVAPVLAAFTLPTIALIATLQPEQRWRNIILCLFVASTGLLLASFQLAVGRLFHDTSGWGAVRAALAAAGLTLLGAGLYLLVLPWNEPKRGVPYTGSREVLYFGPGVLVAGIGIPIIMNMWLWAERHANWVRNLRLSVEENIKKLLSRRRRKATERIKAEAGLLLREIYPAVRDHKELCQVRPSEAGCAGSLSMIVGEAERYSQQNHPSAEAIAQLFSNASHCENCDAVGIRVYALALMQAQPASTNVGCIIESIGRAGSPFEQNQAVQAAIPLLPRLRNVKRKVVRRGNQTTETYRSKRVA